MGSLHFSSASTIEEEAKRRIDLTMVNLETNIAFQSSCMKDHVVSDFSVRREKLTPGFPYIISFPFSYYQYVACMW